MIKTLPLVAFRQLAHASLKETHQSETCTSWFLKRYEQQQLTAVAQKCTAAARFLL